TGQAQALRQRAAGQGGYVEYLAPTFGLSSEQVQRVLAAQGFVVHVDARHYGTPRFLAWEAVLRRLGATPQVRKASAQDLAALRRELANAGRLDDTDLQTLAKARQLIADAAAVGASDIHILVREDHTEVQIRIKGDLWTVASMSMRREEGERLTRSMYSGLATIKEDSYKALNFQNAQIKGEALPGTGLTSVRIIRGPSFPVESGGGFLVARLQYRDLAAQSEGSPEVAKRLDLCTPKAPPGAFRLGEMGYTPLQVELVSRLMHRPMGAVIVTGPTGSGKTTTLYEYTRERARLLPHDRLITIEDPTEYPMNWAIQLVTDSKSFPQMLTKTLRMDPDVVLLGEIRDADAGEATLQAAATGHQVPTTLHVTDPFETFTRLMGMDHVRLSLEIICNHNLIIGLIAQRIVQMLCPHCSVPLDQASEQLPAYMLRALHTWGDLSGVRVRGTGCPHCDGKGIAGEQAVAEVVVTSEALMQDCIEHGVLVVRRNHRRRAGSDKPMIAHAIDLVLAGRLDPRDAQRRVDAIPMRDEIDLPPDETSEVTS
ncbi:MAG: Flp pilus assembly complex ATPase component TadA, partial [Ralstonia sp.]|nr:Flp pilus assembly complex ATPase component TadA [Ralstonia sp.]